LFRLSFVGHFASHFAPPFTATKLQKFKVTACNNS